MKINCVINVLFTEELAKISGFEVVENREVDREEQRDK
jgi:hypothetical protein